jgi:hypothetical protein
MNYDTSSSNCLSVRICQFRIQGSTHFMLIMSAHKLTVIQGIPLAAQPGISLIILPLMRILQRNLKRTTDTFILISHTTNVLLFKFRRNIFTGVTIIKEMLGSVASGTHCIRQHPADSGTVHVTLLRYEHL